MYGEKEKMYFSYYVSRNTASKLETPNFNYGIPTPHTLHPFQETRGSREQGAGSREQGIGNWEYLRRCFFHS